MPSKYAYNTRDIKFILKEWLPLNDVLQCDKFNGIYSLDDIDIFIDQADKISREVIAPTNEDGENNPVRFENGTVYVPKSFAQIYKWLHEQGWGASMIDEEAEGILPDTIIASVTEMMNAANTSLMVYVSLTKGAAGLIQNFGSETIKAMFLPKMFNGSWSGTMCLTEPTAGSDVGDSLSRAYPTEDPQIYKIKGQKIFISGGDGDHVENIVHLYLARIEGAKSGTKGLSLFVVPKYWVDAKGNLEPNDVETVGVEHKLGMKGSSTAALSFGDNNNCRGWLLGQARDENGNGMGMAQMFQMMNEARMGTGLDALCVTANAYWNTVGYCKERIQGRLLNNSKERTAIINHADVKRMLLLNKAITESCRAMIMKAYFYFDIAQNCSDDGKRKAAEAKYQCLTPLCKAYTSDEAWHLIAESIQAHGGYGYSEEYPVAQAARDVKIFSIWEGTNYIQSIDLIERKWNMSKGAAFASLLQDIEEFIAVNTKTCPLLVKEFASLKKSLTCYKEIMATVTRYSDDRKLFFARRILTATAQLYAGFCLLDEAVLAFAKMEELGKSHFDYHFYYGKVLSAQYFIANVLPNIPMVLNIIKDSDTTVVDAPIDIFQY